MFLIYSQMAPTSKVQKVASLRGYGRHMELKVVKSWSCGHFLFICSGTFAVGCIVLPMHSVTESQRDRRTDRRQYDVIGRSHCVRSAKNSDSFELIVFNLCQSCSTLTHILWCRYCYHNNVRLSVCHTRRPRFYYGWLICAMLNVLFYSCYLFRWICCSLQFILFSAVSCVPSLY